MKKTKVKLLLIITFFLLLGIIFWLFINATITNTGNSKEIINYKIKPNIKEEMQLSNNTVIYNENELIAEYKNNTFYLKNNRFKISESDNNQTTIIYASDTGGTSFTITCNCNRILGCNSENQSQCTTNTNNNGNSTAITCTAKSCCSSCNTIVTIIEGQFLVNTLK